MIKGDTHLHILHACPMIKGDWDRIDREEREHVHERVREEKESVCERGERECVREEKESVCERGERECV